MAPVAFILWPSIVCTCWAAFSPPGLRHYYLSSRAFRTTAAIHELIIFRREPYWQPQSWRLESSVPSQSPFTRKINGLYCVISPGKFHNLKHIAGIASSSTAVRLTESSNDESLPSHDGSSDVNIKIPAAKKGVRARVRERVRQMVATTRGSVANTVKPSSVAGVLTDAAVSAAGLAAEEVRSAAREVILQRQRRIQQGDLSRTSNDEKALELESQARIEGDTQVAMDAISLAKTSVADAFDAAEMALCAAEREIGLARAELEAAKKDAALGLAAAERAAAEAAKKARWATDTVARDTLGSAAAVEAVGQVTGEVVGAVVDGVIGEVLKGEAIGNLSTGSMDLVSTSPTTRIAGNVTDDEIDSIASDSLLTDAWTDFDVSSLKYEDVDYTLTDMAPPFINEDECLVPGEPLVRVEKAPQNSRRIFAGIDIPVSVDEVWNLLTDYENLQKVIPNLVVNEVVELFTESNIHPFNLTVDPSISDEEQCKHIASHMKGAILKQVGGAKVVGINFSARTTLEVREWPQGMPDFAHFDEEVYQGKSRSARVQESKLRPLKRYRFPRPFALSSLPHKDISMQSIENDDGEFRMYQGVWRMQPLPGCSPSGESAMRLTYAVEVSPRPYLPVALVEGRIAQDLCANLKAIRGVFLTTEAS